MQVQTLINCLNVDRVRNALESGLRLPAPWRIERVRLSRFWPHKRSRFSIEYLIDMTGDDDDARTVSLQGRWSDAPTVSAQRAFARAPRETCVRPAGLLGVGFVAEELGLVVHSPDRDRRMPWLADALHPPMLAVRLADTDAAERLGIDGGLDSIRCEVASFRSGKRCTLRYRGDTTLYAKTFRDQRGERLARLHDQVADYLASCDVDAIAPRCVDYVAGMNMALVEGMDEPSRGERGLHHVSDADAGRVLAVLHRGPLDVPSIHQPDDELAIAGRWLETFELLTTPDIQGFRGALAQLAAQWTGRGAAAGALLHRDYHAGQLIARHDGTALVDLDTLCRGDPETDVATYLSHVLLDVIGRGGEREAFGERARAFVGSYLDAGGAIDNGRLRCYAISAMLRRGAIEVFRQPRAAATDPLWHAARDILNTRSADRDAWIDLVAGGE